MGYNKYVTIMAEEVKCPNCEEKDRVTIAGRVFCINCGKPFDDGARDDLPRPVAPAKPNATAFNTPTNPATMDRSNQARQPDQRAVQLQAMMNAEPKIIPANAPKAQSQPTGPVVPTSPLEDFDQLVDISADTLAVSDQATSTPPDLSGDQTRALPSTSVAEQFDQPSPVSAPVQSISQAQPVPIPEPIVASPAPAQVEQSADTQSATPAPMPAPTPAPTALPSVQQPPTINNTIESANAIPTQPDNVQPLPVGSTTVPAQTPTIDAPTTQSLPPAEATASVQPVNSAPIAQSLPTPAQLDQSAMAQQPVSIPTLVASQATPSVSDNPAPLAQPAPSPVATPAESVASVPAQPSTPAQPSVSVNQPLPSASSSVPIPPPTPSMTPADRVLSANTTQIQMPSPPAPAPVTTEPAPAPANPVPENQPTAPIASPIPTPPAVDQPAPAVSATPKITKSPISIGKSTTAQMPTPTDSITLAPNNGAPLDLKDKSIMSDDAFDKLLNAPSILSDNVKKVEMTAHSNVISTAPPPFTPPSAPLTTANIKIVPSQAMSDIRPVASVANSAPVAPSSAPVAQPTAPVAPPVQLSASPPAQPTPPPFTPPPVDASVAPEATPSRLMSDIKPSSTQLNGAAVLPADGKLNIHPKHSFMAEPGVVSRVSGEPVSEQDQSAKEQALKMALSSVGEQPAPQIGASFKPVNVALSLVVVGLLGFYIWQVNYPNLAIKVAASKSGVTATVPGYLPSGWKIGKKINASDGMLSYDAINPSINKNIQIVQARTDWDSQALAENYVAPKYPGYTAFQVQGLTIYMYDDNKATWVSNGNWFRIEGQTQALSQDQIIKMATSL